MSTSTERQGRIFIRREQFLTVRWNNRLTLMLGLPALIYAIVFLSTSLISGFWGFIGIVIMGVAYWTVVELHSNMRFAWLRKQAGNAVPVKLKLSYPLNLVYLAYNFIYWIPIVLAFAGVIPYYWGFVGFFTVIMIRGTANLVRNNILKPEQGETFPLRS